MATWQESKFIRIIRHARGDVDALAERGVLANGKRNRIRFGTHAQVDEAAVEAAVAAVADVMRCGARRSDPVEVMP